MSVDLQTQRLFEAIAAINYLQVKRLIDSGVQVNRPNHRGQTPLAVACRQGNLEIVDLLVAAGAQMQAPQALASPDSIDRPSAVPVIDRQDGIASDENIRSPLRNRSSSHEDLIDLINANPTEIEQFVQFDRSLPLAVPALKSDKSDLTNIPDISVPSSTKQPPPQNEREEQTNADNGYTFNLDELSNLIPTGFERPGTEIEFNADENYAFDLSSNLERLTNWEVEEPDRLSIPMGEWEENATYVIDLDPFDRLEAKLEMDVGDRLFIMNEDAFDDLGTFEDGETYAIDPTEMDEGNLMGGMSIAVKPEQYLLPALDSSDFPAIGSEDGADFDPDSQASTDIFGQGKIDADETEDSGSIDNQHSTNTSLMAAIVDGDVDLAQQAIEAGASLDRYDWYLGYSPLGMAIDRGYPDLVKCLLNAGANPRCGSTATTSLGLAAERGEIEIVQMLLPRGIDVNEPVGQDNWTALLAAIKNGHRAVVQLLVTAGANVNIWSRGETPILLAAKCEEREIYNYLYPLVNTSIRLCANRDGEQLLQATRKRRIREQNRPVEKAIAMAMEGNEIEVRRAIEIGVEIDEIGAGGYTALMAAAYYGHQSIVKILLDAGADPNLLSDDDGLGNGMTALMLVAGSFFPSNRQAIFKLLIAGGADVNQQGAGGKTAIMYAALAGSGYQDCVEASIAAGANLDLHDDRGHTLLTLVAAAENYQLLNLLIQSGASTAGLESIQLIQAATTGNVNRVQSLLSTKVNLNLDRGAALGNAAAAGHTKIVDLLIQAGANVNLSNSAGFTPIASAAYAGHAEIVRLLVKAGADIQAPADGSHSYSALEYAQMGLYQFEQEDLHHAQIIRLLEQLEQRC